MIIPPEAEQDAELIADGEYDFQMDTPPASVLDIGGNVGLFSKWAASKWPDALIIAYEPDPENAQRFRENVEEINVHLVEAGVRKDDGFAQLYAGRNVMCRTFHKELDQSGSVGVEVWNVAASLLDRFEFVKIDAEGSEVEIMEGMDLSATKYLAVEYHSEDNRARVRSISLARGFVLHDHFQYSPGIGLYKFTRRVSPRKVFLGNAIDNGAKHAWYRCIDRLMKQAEFQIVQHDVVGDSLVSRARNSLSAAFMHSDCSHLLFIDSDIIFTPDQAERLLNHDVDLVAGFYPKKQQELAWVCNASEVPTKPDERGLQPMRYMGTGFMLISRRVFERMIAAHPEIAYSPDDRPDETEWDFWTVGVFVFPNGTRRYLSEDWYFCQRALDLGFDVLADTGIVVQHLGEATYPLESERHKYIIKK